MGKLVPVAGPTVRPSSDRSAPSVASAARAQTAREMQLHAAEAAALLKALANEQRLLILCHLVSGPLSVGELNARLPLSQSALSQHLAVLREGGIVATEREAQSVRYSIGAGIVRKLIALLHAEFCGR